MSSLLHFLSFKHKIICRTCFKYVELLSEQDKSSELILQIEKGPVARTEQFFCSCRTEEYQNNFKERHHVVFTESHSMNIK
jgi:hypothetical protein